LGPNIDSRTRLEQLFEHETAEFDLDYAFLSRIDLKNETERFEVVHGTHESFKQSTTVPLSQTYCRKTIANPEGTLAVSDAIAEGWEDDPAYELFEFGSYLGTTVSGDYELYGTLCFGNTTARDDPILDKEKAIVEMHGQWVEYTLASRYGQPTWGSHLDTIEGRTIASDAIDLMMDALRVRTRRVILMTLLGDTTETSLATLERRIDGENARIQLLHNDLPKLADVGYIEWDADSGMIFKGPRFPEVEPLVRVLKEYNTTFPE
jgi:hypothetical protein